MSIAAEHRFQAERTKGFALVPLAAGVATFVMSLILLSHEADIRAGRDDLDLVGVGLVAASTLPLLAWRRSPVVVFAVTSAASVLLAGLGYPFGLALGPAVALYFVAASRKPETPWTWPTVGLVVVAIVAYLGAVAATDRSFLAAGLVHAVLPWIAAWFAGERTRLRREHIADLKTRALNAERDAERERRLATAEERARIARDLHDSAGHAVNVIAVRAGAARLGHERDPDRSLAALEAIEGIAQQTASEIDQIVGTLRDCGRPPRTVEAPVGLASLGTLIADHAASGLRVTVERSGEPPPAGGVVDQATYRIIQEALTNAARHGAGSARLGIAFGPTEVDLDVTNPVAVNGTAHTGGGHGLVGMRERATLLGGDLDVDRENGTFHIRARIPRETHRS